MPLINPDLYTVIISLLIIVAFLGVILYSKIREIYDLQAQLTIMETNFDELTEDNMEMFQDYSRLFEINKELIALNTQTVERLSLSEKG